MNSIKPIAADEAIPSADLNDLLSHGTEITPSAELDQTQIGVVPPASSSEHSEPVRYGQYELIRKLGEGGMGAVFLAQDCKTGEKVALKILSAACLKHPSAFQRFEKEARLLEKARNPFIANMLDVGLEGDTRFLVMEYVEGTDLRKWLANRGPLDESTALDIVSDLCRALVSVHSQGMVHRDIKPENVLLSESSGTGRPVIKLTDFGLARHIDQSDSLKLTQTGALLGTPYYMAPEQFKGTGEVSAATDVYALGVTLFELLAGRRPFIAGDPIKLATAHCFNAPPDLRKIVEGVGDALADLVFRMLAKNSTERPLDASALLEEILRLQNGRAAQLVMHPELPEHDASQVLTANFEWSLESTPQELWPLVSNTDRFNQAAGIPPVKYEIIRDDHGQPRKFGHFRMAGMAIKWEEHPFEWIEGRRFSILREFPAGPFVWFLSTVELIDRPEGGTLLRHHVKILPRGIVGRLLAQLEVGIKGRRNLDRIYRRIDVTLRTRSADRVTDHFQQPAGMTRGQRMKLRAQLDDLRSVGVSEQITTVMHDLLTNAAAQDLARIRPYAIARRFGLPERDFVDACLHAAQHGLLTMAWDLICPSCRLTADSRQTLREIDQHANCSACQTNFTVEFGGSIELVFRAHPEVRKPDGRLYCNGGPGNFPHVIAQVSLQPGERMVLSLALATGSYLLRGPGLPYTIPIEVDSHRGTKLGCLRCAPGNGRQPETLLLAGRQQLTLENSFPMRQLIRIERSIRRTDAMTAAEVTGMPLFRELFPQEKLQLGQLVQLATTNFLAIQLDDLVRVFREEGDSGAYLLLRDFHQVLSRHVRAYGGTPVDEQTGSMLVTFADLGSAIDAAMGLSARLQSELAGRQWSLSGCLHRGPALVTSDRQGIRYFGANVNETWRLAHQAKAGRLLMTYETWADPSAIPIVADDLIAVPDVDDSLRQVDLNVRRATLRTSTKKV